MHCLELLTECFTWVVSLSFSSIVGLAFIGPNLAALFFWFVVVVL